MITFKKQYKKSTTNILSVRYNKKTTGKIRWLALHSAQIILMESC